MHIPLLHYADPVVIQQYRCHLKIRSVLFHRWDKEKLTNIHEMLYESDERSITGVTFSLARYSTTPPSANVNTCPIPVHPM